MRCRFRRILPALTAGLLVISCGETETEDGADTLTATEGRQLDAAAERLDSEREAYEAGMAAQARADAAAAAQADSFNETETSR